LRSERGNLIYISTPGWMIPGDVLTGSCLFHKANPLPKRLKPAFADNTPLPHQYATYSATRIAVTINAAILNTGRVLKFISLNATGWSGSGA
jgi:hypothetical protein